MHNLYTLTDATPFRATQKQWKAVLLEYEAQIRWRPSGVVEHVR